MRTWSIKLQTRVSIPQISNLRRASAAKNHTDPRQNNRQPESIPRGRKTRVSHETNLSVSTLSTVRHGSGNKRKRNPRGATPRGGGKKCCIHQDIEEEEGGGWPDPRCNDNEARGHNSVRPPCYDLRKEAEKYCDTGTATDDACARSGRERRLCTRIMLPEHGATHQRSVVHRTCVSAQRDSIIFMSLVGRFLRRERRNSVGTRFRCGTR